MGERWCADCRTKLIQLDEICPICGDRSTGGVICRDCQNEPPPFHQMRAAVVYKSPLREAIHKLKYKHDIGLGEALSGYLIELYDKLGWKVDLIIPVPLSPSKKQERGYNQSALLAWPLAKARCIQYQPGAVERIRDTRRQVELNARERRENVKDAFMASAEVVRGKRVLVIDDVTTTGATLQACCKAVQAAGADGVYAMTLARAVFGDDIPSGLAQADDHEQPVLTLY